MIIYENIMFQLKERERKKARNMFYFCIYTKFKYLFTCIYTKCDESQHQVSQENM